MYMRMMGVISLVLPVENIVDLFADVRTEAEKLSIYPMQDCLQEISLTRIFAVK